MKKPSSLIHTPKERVFSAEELEHKRAMYERLSARRRGFIDRIGYDAWDPFEAPKEPMDIRIDVTARTVQELVREFLQSAPQEIQHSEYAQGVMECAFGIVSRQEKYMGALDFCVWYHDLLLKGRTSK